MCPNWLKTTALILTVIGGLNWGLVGLFGFDLVAWLAMTINAPILARIIYVIVGVCAVLVLVEFLKDYDCDNRGRPANRS